MSPKSQNRNRGRILPILDVSQDDWIFKKDEFNSVLDKVGNRPVAIYSINGQARGGKSFLLNYFIRHFEEQLGNSAKEIDSELFKSGSGVGRVTVGINLWSKPYFVQTDAGEVAVLLLDTQGLFDPQTPFRKNAIIFTISCFLSSVMMYNQKGALLENVLEDIGRFSNFAKQLTYNTNLTVTREGGRDHLIDTSSNLLFILRDFDVLEYSYGLHNAREAPQEQESDRNYFSDVLSSSTTRAESNFTEESLDIRRRLLHLYSDVSAYLLPHPGNNFVRRRQPIPDEDFEQEAKSFVKTITSRKYIAKKVILEDTVTSDRFKLCIESIVELCTNSSAAFADLISMTECDKYIQSTKIVNDAVELYETELSAFIMSHPEEVSADIFQGAHCDAERRSGDLQRNRIIEMDVKYIKERLNNDNKLYSKVRSVAIVSGIVLATASVCVAALPVVAAVGPRLAAVGPKLAAVGHQVAGAIPTSVKVGAASAIKQCAASAAMAVAASYLSFNMAQAVTAATVAVGSPVGINAVAQRVVGKHGVNVTVGSSTSSTAQNSKHAE